MSRPRPPVQYLGKNLNHQARGRAVTLERDAQIWELKREGKSTAQIAKSLNLTTRVVDESISRIFREYRVGLTGEVEAKAGELISQYEYVRDEALEAWRQSKQARNRVSQTTTKRADEQDRDDSGVVSTTASQEDQHGDTKYLDAAMKAMDKLASLLRIGDAVQVAVTHTHQAPDGGPVRVMHDINYDELEGPKLAQYLASLGQAAIVVSQPLIDVTPVEPPQLPAAPAPASTPTPEDDDPIPF